MAEPDIRLEGEQLNNVSQCVMLILSLEGSKIYSQTGWGPWLDFPLDPPLRNIRFVYPDSTYSRYLSFIQLLFRQEFFHQSSY